jgi:hypothetical protein
MTMGSSEELLGISKTAKEKLQEAQFSQVPS